MFEKSNLLLALATISRTPVASPKGKRARDKSAERKGALAWLHETLPTEVGYKTLDFGLSLRR